MGFFFKNYLELNAEGLQLLNAGDFVRASKLFAKAIDRCDSFDPVLYWNLGLCHYGLNGMSDDAWANFVVAAEGGDLSAQGLCTAYVLNVQGIEALNAEQLYDAEVSFSEAVESAPFAVALFHWNLGYTQLCRGDESKGWAHVQYAAELGSPDALELLSQQSEGDIDWGQLGKGAAAVAGIALDVALSFFS